MNEHECMSQEERIHRVGALCSKAVTLMVMAEKESARNTFPGEVTAEIEKESQDDWISQGIVNYLKRFGCAGPREMVRYLDVKRTTCFRRLKDLREKGLIEARGHGRGVQYSVTAQAIINRR